MSEPKRPRLNVNGTYNMASTWQHDNVRWGEDAYETECRCGALGNQVHATDCAATPICGVCGRPLHECAARAYDGPERRLHEPRRSTDKWPGFTSNTGSPFPGDRRRPR